MSDIPCAMSPAAMSPAVYDSGAPSPPAPVPAPCMRSCSPPRDSLFLLEVLVDKVTFKKAPCFADKDFKTCVAVASPVLAPFEICDDEPDSGPPTHSPFSRNFNNGKSCLFCMKEADIKKSMAKFPIKIQVFRTLPCGCIPTKILMGQADIDMTKEFIETRNRHMQDPNAVSYQALKDTFQLHVDGEPTGDISMYIRISCFGKLICTKFQGAGGSLALGQGGTGVTDRSCKFERDFQTPEAPCACGVAFGHGGGAGGARGKPPGSGGVCPETGSPCPKLVDVYNSTPCERDEPCYCCGPRPEPPDPAACRNTDKYCLHVPRGISNKPKQFEEMGTSSHGHELKIKVPVAAAVIKKLSQTRCCLQRPFEDKEDRKKKEACEAPCGKNQISLALPNEDICCNGPRPQMTQFTCTTEGCTQASKHGQAANASRPFVDPNPNRDTFVLKVAKTAMQGDRKVKLEMELVTPKGPDKRLPVQKADTKTQSEFACLCGVRRLKRARRPIKSCL